ncbi:hypothetical protein B9Z19DRAFT_1121218 [Tuber borchii]|uniref:Uncharacterized protein n=1 Tax=Tuber borchii TaxID=42251 RepID=A0A2T7A341_TUBBO|nr:hypothetical protein B9Z19DRAFT_1121218 [Tuber borchii]
MPLTTLPTKLTRQISQQLETRTPNSHAVLRICLRPDTLQVLTPLLIPIASTTKTQEDTLEATYTPADADDKTLLRRLRRCGLIAHPKVNVTVSPLQRAMRTLSYGNRDVAAAASAWQKNLPREVFVNRWDTVGVFVADHVTEGDGFVGDAFSPLAEKDELMDAVWGLLMDGGVNIHVDDRYMPLEMMAGGRRVGVVRVLLLGKDEGCEEARDGWY